MPGTKLRVAAEFANTPVTRIRRHNTPVCALRGNVPAGRSTLFALGVCDSRKTTHGTEYGNSEEYLDHVPTPLMDRLARPTPNLGYFAAMKARFNISRRRWGEEATAKLLGLQ